MNTHPDLQALRTCINQVRQTVADIEASGKSTSLDMYSGYVEETNCTTTACFGGWCYLAAGRPAAPKPVHELSDPPSDYELGADWLATQCGFINRHALANWAHTNPNLWGNPWGANMFSDTIIAYRNDPTSPTGNPGILDILDHFDAVADRIEANTGPGTPHRQPGTITMSPTGCSPSPYC